MPPQNFTGKVEGKSVLLKWDAPAIAQDNEKVYGYVLYRFTENEKFDLADPRNILHIQYDTESIYLDTNVQPGKTYFYVVTALDRIKNESDRSPTIAVTAK